MWKLKFIKNIPLKEDICIDAAIKAETIRLTPKGINCFQNGNSSSTVRSQLSPILIKPSKSFPESRVKSHDIN